MAGNPLARLVRRRSLGFPFVAPTWPQTVPREDEDDGLGSSYDTAWARRYGVRIARAMVVDNIELPAMRLWARPAITGTDRLAAITGAVVFAANHASHADMPLVLTSLPARFRHRLVVAAAADYFFDKRWKATLSAFALNAIPIERTKLSRASIELPLGLLRDGWSLLLFPEGGRSPDGWGHEHQRGAAYLAEKAGVAVVPLHLAGTRRILKKGSTRPRPARTAITFGAPLRPTSGEASRSFAARVEHAVERLADEQSTDWWSAARRAAKEETPTLRGPAAASWRRTWHLGEGRRAPRKGPAWPKL